MHSYARTFLLINLKLKAFVVCTRNSSCRSPVLPFQLAWRVVWL